MRGGCGPTCQLPKKWGNPLSTEDRVKLVRHAYDSGIRDFDTAVSYTFDKQMTVEQCMEVHSELVKARDKGQVRFVDFSAHHYFDKALALISTNEFDLCMLAYGYLPRGNSRLFSPRRTELRNACLAKAHELQMGIVAMKVLGAGMLGGFGKKELGRLPGAAIRYVLQDDRVHMLTIGMRYPAEIDANIKAFAGSTTYTSQDRALLADVSAAVLNDENVKSMSVE